MKYLRILKEQKSPIRFVISRLLMRSGLSRFLTIPQNGFKLGFYPTALSATLWVENDNRSGDLEFYKDYLRTGDTVVDIGANIGQLAIGAAKIVGDSGAVYAFEPHPEIYSYFKKNIALNNCEHIHAYNMAVGNEAGVLFISNKRNDDQNTIVKNQQSGISIKQIKLDDMDIIESKIDLLKVDVEGYEKFVFEGARLILEKTECIYYESWQDHFEKYGCSVMDVQRILEMSGFTIYRFNGKKCLSPVKEQYNLKNCENLIAIKDASRFCDRTGYKID
jgi:FkbM family methyltransferase